MYVWKSCSSPQRAWSCWGEVHYFPLDTERNAQKNIKAIGKNTSKLLPSYQQRRQFLHFLHDHQIFSDPIAWHLFFSTYMHHGEISICKRCRFIILFICYRHYNQRSVLEVMNQFLFLPRKKTTTVSFGSPCVYLQNIFLIFPFLTILYCLEQYAMMCLTAILGTVNLNNSSIHRTGLIRIYTQVTLSYVSFSQPPRLSKQLTWALATVGMKVREPTSHMWIPWSPALLRWGSIGEPFLLML